MSWQIRLGGSLADLEALTEVVADADLRVSADDKGYLLESDWLDTLADAMSAVSRADELIASLNGLAKVHLDDFEGVRFAGISSIGADGSVVAHDWGTAVGRAVISGHEQLVGTDGLVVADIEFRSRPALPDLAPALRVSTTDPAVATLLRVLAGERDWRTLYFAYEVIEADVGGPKEITAAGWASDNAIELFKWTANSPSAIGDDARHGRERTQPPARPMSLTDARLLLDRLARAWVASK